MLDYSEDGLIIDSPLIGVAFKRIHFRFGWEDSDIWVKFRSLFHSLYIYSIRLMDKF